jgi:hypothetical protein
VYGTHAQRLEQKPGTAPDGTVWVETDRGNVLYHLQDGVWWYVAGTMFGTLDPDERPADLGLHDVGFNFRTNITPAREFIWSDDSWIEVTPARFGTHAERLAAPADFTADGTLWIETDRGNAVYQLQSGLWWYLAGTMYGTLSPDQRPADLGLRDGGFEFRTSVPPQRHFIWSQTAWEEVTPPLAGDVQRALSSVNLILTTTPALVPGTLLTLNRAGRYLITGNVTFIIAGGTDITGQSMWAKLIAAGVEQAGYILASGFDNFTAAGASQQWVFQAAVAGLQVYLAAYKGGGTGSSQTEAGATSITAQWISG